MTKPEIFKGLDEYAGITDAKDIVKNVFRSILLEEQWHEEFYLHPLGFYYCRLFLSSSEQVRLHIWAPDYIKKQDLFIHDHYYDLCSWVLCGTIRDYAYSVKPSNVPTQHIVYTSGYHADQNIRTIAPTSEYKLVSVEAERLIVAPKKYFISRETFHANEVLFDQAELAVTLVYAYNYKAEHRPNIIGQAGAEHGGENESEIQSEVKVTDLIQKAEKIIFS